MKIEKKDPSKLLVIKNVCLSNGDHFDELKYIGTVELFYTQLMLRDFMLFEKKDEELIMINVDNILYFDQPKIPNEMFDDFLDKHMDITDYLYNEDDDDGDDDPPNSPGPNKNRKKGHLTIIK